MATAQVVTARIMLRPDGPLSFSGKGRTLKRGESFVTQDAADILYFRSQGSFSVDMLEGTIKQAKAIVARPEGREVADEASNPPGERSAAKAPPVKVVPASPSYTSEELSKLTKSALVQIIQQEGWKIDTNQSKMALIAAIMAESKVEETEDEETEESDEGEDWEKADENEDDEG